jgi:hypothetical protein
MSVKDLARWFEGKNAKISLKSCVLGLIGQPTGELLELGGDNFPSVYVPADGVKQVFA